MATLSAIIQGRIAEQKLIEWTNFEDRSQNAINTGVLNNACTDAVSEFQVITSTVFSSSDPLHVAAAIHGVLYYLQVYRGIPIREISQYENRWINALDRLKRVTGNNRITPSTNAVAVPSPENPGLGS